jgi:alcohol dehydrogenase
VRAVIFEHFRGPLSIVDIADPSPPVDGVVVRVEANGVCRSDWHAWQGHDPDIELPHVPGHELAGVIVATGAQVRRWKVDDRVTVPFVLGCGECPRCVAGQQQVCDHQYQPGFTGWGSMSEYVALPRADLNLVALPDALGFADAASLGCRFATAFRAVAHQARVAPGQWLAVHGCGGVGLSAIMIAEALGIRTVAVDVDDQALALAGELGATHVVDGRLGDAAATIVELTGGGAHSSMDAVGTTATCLASIHSLRTQGRHVQVGLMVGDDSLPPIPMSLLHGREIELTGSHGMASHAYPRMLAMVASGRLDPRRLVTSRLSLTDGMHHLERMHEFPGAGMAVVTDMRH